MAEWSVHFMWSSPKVVNQSVHSDGYKVFIYEPSANVVLEAFDNLHGQKPQ